MALPVIHIEKPKKIHSIPPNKKEGFKSMKSLEKYIFDNFPVFKSERFTVYRNNDLMHFIVTGCGSHFSVSQQHHFTCACYGLYGIWQCEIDHVMNEILNVLKSL